MSLTLSALLAAALWLAPETVGARVGGSSGSGQSAGHFVKSADFKTAERWLASFKANDPASFGKLTALPFAFGTINHLKRCEGTFKDAAALAEWAKCVRTSQDLLVYELDGRDEVQLEGLQGSPAKGMKALVKKLSGPGKWVRAFMNGDEVSFELRFLVVKPRNGPRQIAVVILDEEVEDPQ